MSAEVSGRTAMAALLARCTMPGSTPSLRRRSNATKKCSSCSRGLLALGRRGKRFSRTQNGSARRRAANGGTSRVGLRSNSTSLGKMPRRFMPVSIFMKRYGLAAPVFGGRLIERVQMSQRWSTGVRSCFTRLLLRRARNW